MSLKYYKIQKYTSTHEDMFQTLCMYKAAAMHNIFIVTIYASVYGHRCMYNKQQIYVQLYYTLRIQ